MKRRLNPRSIFWRFCLRSLQVKRPQAALGIGSLIVGAAVCSLLLNLYGGVEHKMAESFRAFGANVILTPRVAASPSGDLPSVMPEPAPGQLASLRERWPGSAAVPVLYAVTRLHPSPPDPRLPGGENVAAVGTDLAAYLRMNPNWHLQRAGGASGPEDCAVGAHVAAELQLHPGGEIRLESLPTGATDQTQSQTFRIAAVVSTGASQDDQVFVPLPALQRLAGSAGSVSAIELRLPGTSAQIEAGINQLAGAFPHSDVRPVRQIVYSEGRVLGDIRRLMLALTALILGIIALCVAATMTAIVLERRKDIAVMKALGASDRLVMELFLSEGAGLGLVGGLAGFFLGALAARWLALRLFDVALAPSWWVFPIVCAATVALALAATLFPVRIVRRIQPAVVLKGS
ncbi:MAG TPA: FtsX-like permease family protein [Terriglobia bacterium]|nr:FtsX-like permease family protein [Terriglobia bacterium]